MTTDAKNVVETAKQQGLVIREKSERKTRQTDLLALLVTGEKHNFTATGKVSFIKVYNADPKAKPVYDLFALTDEGTKVPVSKEDCASLKAGSKIVVTLAFNEYTDDNADMLKRTVEYDNKQGFILFDTVQVA